MKTSEKHQAERIWTARFFAAIIVLTLFLSAAFLIKEADHNCTGADCPICEMMAQCSSNIRLLGTGVVTAVLWLAPVMDSLWKKDNSFRLFLVFPSLVTQNIRMDD